MRHRMAASIIFIGVCAAVSPGAAKAQAAANAPAPNAPVAPATSPSANPIYPDPGTNPVPNTLPNPVTVPSPVDGIAPLSNMAAPSAGGQAQAAKGSEGLHAAAEQTHPGTGEQAQPATGARTHAVDDNTSAADSRLSRTVRDSLAQQFPRTPGANGAATGGIAGLKVTTRNGRTILRGTVHTQQQKTDAALSAAEVPGVGKNIDNQIIVR